MPELIGFVLALALTFGSGGPVPDDPGHHCPCLNAAQVRALVALYPDWDKDAMLWLAGEEASLSGRSGRIYHFGALNLNDNGSTDACGWQINSIHGYDQRELRSDPFACVAAAHDVWLLQGYGAWATW